MKPSFEPAAIDRIAGALPAVAMLALAVVMHRGLPVTAGIAFLRAFARLGMIAAVVAGVLTAEFLVALGLGIFALAFETASLALASLAAATLAGRAEIEFRLLLGMHPGAAAGNAARRALTATLRGAAVMAAGAVVGSVPAMLAGRGGDLQSWRNALLVLFALLLTAAHVASRGDIAIRDHRVRLSDRDRLRHGFRISESPPPPFARPQVYDARPDASEEGGFPTIH
jgi:hypothetical protein